MSDVDIDELIRGRRSRWRWLAPLALAVIAAAAVGAYLFVPRDEAEVVAEPERVEAVAGRLSTTLALTGSAAAERSAELSFESSGVVAAVEAAQGDAVSLGDALARLDDTGARRRVRTAEVQLAQARLRLDDLLADPAAADLAAARQSVTSAQAQVASAEAALARLLDPASDAELASAEQAVANALAQWSSAAEALVGLVERPADEEVASARSAITQAEAALSAARDREDAASDTLDAARDDFCESYDHLTDETVEATCAASLPLTDGEVAALRDSLDGRSTNYGRYAEPLISANVASVDADAARQSAESALASSRARLDDLLAPPSDDDRYQAEQAVEAARANHEAAVARLDDLRAPPDEDEVAQARASLDSARAGLTTAWARLDDLTAGSTANAIAQQELNVQLAEISLEEARDALDALTLYAPFDGVIEAVNVRPGDRVGASLAAFSLSTSGSIVIDLTVSEADLLGLALGQAGLATFDSVEGVEYPVRIAAISRSPNAAQGVVTYDVQARLVTGPELAEIADALAVLGGGAGFGLGGLDLGALAGLGAGLGGARAGEGGAGRGALGALGGAGRGDFGAGMLDALDLPEGVTLEDVLEALASGEPLPEGVSLPDDLPIPPQMLQRIAAAVLAGGALDADADSGASARPGAAAARPLPAPGMTASVTVLTELREEAVLVPVAAVRQIDGAWYVAVPAAGAAPEDGGAPAFERVAVEIGDSDGVNVEVTSGVEAGAALLIGADTEGVAFSAIQPQQQAPVPGFGPGGFPGGGIPRGGGGQ